MFGASSTFRSGGWSALAQVVALLAGAACFACCWFAVSDVLLAPAVSGESSREDGVSLFKGRNS